MHNSGIICYLNLQFSIYSTFNELFKYLTGLNAIKQFKFLTQRKQTFVVLKKQQVMLPYFHPNHANIVYYFHPNHTNLVYYWLLPATLQVTDAVQ